MQNDETLASALLRVQTAWKLGDLEMAALSHAPLETFLDWKRRASEPTEATIPSGMQSASHVVALHRKLERRFKKLEEQIEWLTSPHSDFENNKPLDIALTTPENLHWLNYYLESSTKEQTS